MAPNEKLVRDEIPFLAMNEGKSITVRTVTGVDLLEKAREKLAEEVGEYLRADSLDEQLEELIDLHEAILLLLRLHGISETDFKNAVIAKREARGAFSRGIVMTVQSR